MKNSAQVMLRQNLIETVKAFQARWTLSHLSIGTYSINNQQFVGRVVDDPGFNFGMKQYDRVMLWMAQNWPEGATWPAHVPRPSDDGEQAA